MNTSGEKRACFLQEILTLGGKHIKDHSLCCTEYAMLCLTGDQDRVPLS